MENKDFDTIMREITGGLTGDEKYDIEYLMAQSEKYKESEYNIEIMRACYRMIYDLMPEDMKDEFSDALNKDMKGTDATLDEIQFLRYKKEYKKALKLMESLIQKCEKADVFPDDSVSEYHTFKEPFEEILYHFIHNPEKEIRPSSIRYSEMYYQYGSLLIDLKRYDDAQKALEKGLKWNPVSTQIAFERTETFKLRGMMEEYYQATRDIFKIAFRPSDLARCYRNLGYYYVEKGELQVAVCCLVFSIPFSSSDLVQSELFYIYSLDHKLIMNPDMQTIQINFKGYDIPLGPDEGVISLAYYFAKQSIEQGQKELAQYFISILISLLGEDIEELQELQEQIDKM